MQLLGWGIAAIGALCLVIVTWFWVTHATSETPGDTHNYILTGLRLNAGHPLYTYGPGDVHARVFDVGSPAYALYSPPLIGVLFRPIVLLPANGLYVWWVAMCAMELLAVGMLVRRAPLVVGLALIPLSVPIAVAMEVANADCLVLFGMLIAWQWLVAGHDDRAALLIAFLASIKLTPLFFVWWLLITGRRRAAGVAVICGAALALVAMLGSEPLIMVKFSQVMTANLNVPTISSIGPVGLARVAGLPGVVVTWLPRALLVSGIAAMWFTRRWPGVSFAIGAVLMWLASPIASLHTPALVLIAFAPLAWPMMARSHSGRGSATPPEPATPEPATPEPALLTS
jgi:hypothetical protein